MTTNSPLQLLTVPVAGDAPDGPTQVTNLAKALEQKLVMTFTSAADRTSKFTAAGISPAAGMLCYRADAPGLNRFEYYSATAGAWRIHGAYQDSVTLGSAGTVTFSSIPTYLRALRITAVVRGDAATGTLDMRVRFGGDTAAVYDYAGNYMSNSATGGGGINGQNQTSAHVGFITAASATAGRFAAFRLDVTGWDAPSGHTTGCQAVWQTGAGGGATNYAHAAGMVNYAGTSALTSINLFPSSGSFVTGSEFTLWGSE